MLESHWRIEIERVAEALADSNDATFPHLALRLHKALCIAPPEVGAALGPPCSRQQIESLLACGAQREAALELFGKAHYMVSRGVHGFAIASVTSDLFPESTLSSDHEATAYAGALALGLRDWARAAATFSASRAAR
ncbi:hypothetical protein ACWPM1_13395 [Tsuneonella sp. HG249]